jgi:hypothetical protein
MFTFRKWIRSAFRPAARRTAPRAHLGLECLETRLVPANLDMTQVAIAHGVYHPNPTHIYLNFDGGQDDRGNAISAYNDGAKTDQDIQDILYRTSEIYAPFNVEVLRIYGAGNYFQGNDGSTTVFVGSNSGNANSGGKFIYSYTPASSDDGPGGVNPVDHRPDSYGHHVAFVDPFGAGNTVAQSMAQIAQTIAHECGHTFGLAHVRTDGQTDPAPLGAGTVGDIMSYNTNIPRTAFVNQTLPITIWNNTGTQTVLDSSQQPSWVLGTLLGVPVFWAPITTQNSYTYLTAVLGTSPNDGIAHVADLDTINASDDARLAPQTALAMNTPFSGLIGYSGDYEVFMIQPTQTGSLHIDLRATSPGLSPVVMVHDASDNLQTLTPSGPNGFNFSATAGKNYFVIVGSHDGQSAGSYLLTV